LKKLKEEKGGWIVIINNKRVQSSLRNENGEKGGGLTLPTIREFKALRETKEKRRGVDRQQQESYKH
jgi:hypothetical protein